MPEFILLSPSDICYSQSSISSKFADGSNIGELLEDILVGTCFVSDIPFITVVKFNSSWVTMDNRRLWVFKQLESLDRCDLVQVKVRKKLPPNRLTTKTQGKSIQIRGKVVTRSGCVLCFPDTEKVDRSSGRGKNQNESNEPEACLTHDEPDKSTNPSNKKKKRRRRPRRHQRTNANNSHQEKQVDLRESDLAVVEEHIEIPQNSFGDRHCYCRSTISTCSVEEQSQSPDHHQFDDNLYSYYVDNGDTSLSDEGSDNTDIWDDENLVERVNVWDEPDMVGHHYHRNEYIDLWSDARTMHSVLNNDNPLLESYIPTYETVPSEIVDSWHSPSSSSSEYSQTQEWKNDVIEPQLKKEGHHSDAGRRPSEKSNKQNEQCTIL